MMSRPGHGRKIVELTLLAFAAVGVLLLFGLFRSRSDLLASLSTGTGIATLVVYFVVAVVPAGLPAALAGARRAATLIEREPPGRTFATSFAYVAGLSATTRSVSCGRAV